MTRGRELKVLPGITEEADGTKKESGLLPEREKEQFRERICQEISRKMSAYYSVRKEEWAEFAEMILQEKNSI